MAERGWVIGTSIGWSRWPCGAALMIGALTAVLTALSGSWALNTGAIGLLGCVVAGVVAPFVVLGLRRSPRSAPLGQ
jgi:hypothetical protein